MLKLPFSVYVVINDSWFLILKMNEYLAACFYKYYVLEKQKLIMWVLEVKSYEKRQLKKESIIF